MHNIIKECINVLTLNNEKKFALVINDKMIKVDGKQVYIKTDSGVHPMLVTFIYRKVSNRINPIIEEVDLSSYWQSLKESKVYAGFDFGEYLSKNNLHYSIVVNTSFDLFFIESPILTLIKACIKRLESEKISNLSIANVSNEFMFRFKENWFNILSQFQIDSILSYINLVKGLKIKLNKKLFFPPNCIFKSSLVENRVNFLHLFLRTSGLYNPFLQDSQLSFLLKGTRLSLTMDNIHLFLRRGNGYDLYCMTPTDFCLALSLKKKIGFDTETALLFLGSLLYRGNIKTLQLPLLDTKGYWTLEMVEESNGIISKSFTLEYTTDLSKNDKVLTVSALEKFVMSHNIRLGERTMDIKEMVSILSNAYIRRE